MDDFGFGLLVLSVLIIAFMGTFLIRALSIIRTLKNEIEKLKKYIYELINSAGRGNN